MESIKQIAFIEPNVAALIDAGTLDLSNIASGCVAVKMTHTTISCGTERANLIGEKNVAGNSDTVPPFPRYSGYSGAGVVAAVGEGVTEVKPGDRVAIYWGAHKNYNVVPQDRVVKLPDGVDDASAAIAFISSFSLAAIRKLDIDIGESCLIMGLGILGQCAVRYARIAGAHPVIAVDPKADRRAMALRGGADYALDPTAPDFAETVRSLTHGGANTCVEVTGLGVGLNGALDCMARFGRIALLGCTRNKDFTLDYYKKVHCPGITLIGAHTNARPSEASYPHNFTHNDDIRIACELIAGGRLDLKAMICETHTPDACAQVYHRLAHDADFPVCVQFDWRRSI